MLLLRFSFFANKKFDIYLPAQKNLFCTINCILCLRPNSFARKIAKLYILIVYILLSGSSRFVCLFPFVQTVASGYLPNHIDEFLQSDLAQTFKSFLITKAPSVYKHRFNILFATHNGRNYFAKVDPPFSSRLENEFRVNSLLNKTDFGEFFVSLAEKIDNSKYYCIVFSSLEASFKFHRPLKLDEFPKPLVDIIASFSVTKILINHDALLSLSWIMSVVHIVPSFLELSLHLFHDEVLKVGFCHGDMTSENLYYSNCQLKIIDWENSSFDAPAAVDVVGFWISIYFSTINKNSAESSFLKLQNDLPNYSNADLFFALAYLAYVTGSKEACKLFHIFVD